jgi:phosphoribosyl 1,2-cyclic phosphodiesterase
MIRSDHTPSPEGACPGAVRVKVTFFGTRGSVPVAEPEFATFGGNTACVMLTFENERIGFLDAGTGLRKAGRHMVQRGIEQYSNLLIGLSHTHWDHIQGFPFFGPAYDPRRTLTIAIPGRTGAPLDLEAVFGTQMRQEFFPVPLEGMGSKIVFWQPEVGTVELPRGVQVRTSRHPHPGGAYGYRISEGDRSVVYVTDVEHGDRIVPSVVELARGADLLIHDAQYTPEELKGKRGWGHSSWDQAVEVALLAKVKRVALSHHDPDHDDAFLMRVEKEAQRLFSEAFLAREGMEIVL